MPKLLALAKNGLNYQEKASFSLILTKSVEPIFQSAGPILRHTALEGTLTSRGGITNFEGRSFNFKASPQQHLMPLHTKECFRDT